MPPLNNATTGVPVSRHALRAVSLLSPLLYVYRFIFWPVARPSGIVLDPSSILKFPYNQAEPEFPHIKRDSEDPFLKQIASTGKKWITLTDESGQPRHVFNAFEFLRAALFGESDFNPVGFCKRPVITRDPELHIGKIIGRLKVEPGKPGDEVIDVDLILLWTDRIRRIITGSDILGRLLRKVVRSDSPPQMEEALKNLNKQ